MPSWPCALAFPLMNWNDPSGRSWHARGLGRPAPAPSPVQVQASCRLSTASATMTNQARYPARTPAGAGRARRHPGTQRVAGCRARHRPRASGPCRLVIGLAALAGTRVSPAGRSRPVRPCLARDRACVTPDRTSSLRRPGPAGRPAQGPRSGSDAQRRAAGTGPRSRAGRSR